jgi:hypothetical protein
MQGPTPPTEDDEASIPAEHDERNGPHGPFFFSAGNRKAAKRTFPFDLKTGETIQLALPQPPQAEEIPARKRRRLEESLPTLADEATTENSPHDTTVALPPTASTADAAADHDDDAAADHDDDQAADLADLCPVMHPIINPTTARTGKWTEDENKKLREAVPARGDKNWDSIAALVPSRTKNQCSKKWRNTLSNIDPATARTGQWTPDEDEKLKDAVLAQGDKDWKAIALLVSSRTNAQCRSRWHNHLNSNVDATTARTGRWTADEDQKLKDAVPAQGDKDWKAIALLVIGRTNVQCRSRWREKLTPSIDQVSRCTGKWGEDEDIKLKNAVTLCAKNWEEITSMVPGRTKVQCRNRWHDALKPSIDQVTRRKGRWTGDEDKMLKEAVRVQGAKNWETIASLVSGRTKNQCYKRWHIPCILASTERRHVPVNGQQTKTKS